MPRRPLFAAQGAAFGVVVVVVDVVGVVIKRFHVARDAGIEPLL